MIINGCDINNFYFRKEIVTPEWFLLATICLSVYVSCKPSNTRTQVMQLMPGGKVEGGGGHWPFCKFPADRFLSCFGYILLLFCRDLLYKLFQKAIIKKFSFRPSVRIFVCTMRSTPRRTCRVNISSYTPSSTPYPLRVSFVCYSCVYFSCSSNNRSTKHKLCWGLGFWFGL